MNIILGSASPWRQQILKAAGYKFSVMCANINEKKIRHEDPKQLTLEIARAKADALISKIKKPSLLITCDQVVVCADRIFEKPTSEAEVLKIYGYYNKYPAETVTAVVVTNTETKKSVHGIDSAKIYFHSISDEVARQLIEKGEIFQCAGGFQIEGAEGSVNACIKSYTGSLDSIKGLPMKLVRQLMDRVG